MISPTNGINRYDETARFAHPRHPLYPQPDLPHVLDDLAGEDDIEGIVGDGKVVFVNRSLG